MSEKAPEPTSRNGLCSGQGSCDESAPVPPSVAPEVVGAAWERCENEGSEGKVRIQGVLLHSTLWDA